MMLGFVVSLWGTELLLQILGLFTILWGTATCRTASLRCKPVFWPYLLVFTTLCRIGEATNPGPQSNFVLGAFNPSGLKGKAPYIVSQLLYGDIWAVSETHLCSQALHAFKTSLRFAKSPFGYCVGGYPVPSQQDRLFHSAWRGVAVLSKFPTREVPTVIPPAILSSSRLVVTTTLVNDVWITGGTIYGEPESSSYPHQKLNNETLLHHATAHVCHLAKGPRYLAGDWNQLQHTSPSFELMEAAGFRDLQDIASEHWGRPIENTCKHATRKDFCYISRELQHLLLRVGMSHDVFPDHAVIWGEFSAIGNVLPRQIWVSPCQFPWPRDWDIDPNFWDAHTGDCDTRYHMLWQHIETQACRALPFPAPKNALGRAATTDVRPVVDGKVSPPKKARDGDIKPHYVCATFRHSQWLRQTRRIQAYVRHVSNQGPHSDHARQLWGAIIRATGFSPSFVAWWEQSDDKVLGAPGTLPYVPPALDLAEKIFDSFAIAFRNFELELHRASRAYAKQKREMNPNAIFHDLHASKENGVALLIKPITAKVESVHSEHGEVVLDREVSFDLQHPIFCNGQRLEVAHADLDAMWVEDVENIPVGATVSQTRCQGTDAELFTLFLDAWKQMWDRHRAVPAPRWEPILRFARAKLVFPQLTWPAIDCAALSHSIAHKKASTSGGLDGVSLADLKAMPAAACQNFVAMFHHAENTGDWPQQVIAGRVSCLAKTAQPADALDFRPITVLGLLYRCWSTFHAKQAIRAIDGILPTGLYGSRAQCHAGQVWSQLLWTIELAYENNTPLCGIMADIQKAFNFLARPVVMECCALVGIPFHVLRGWAGALAKMPRRFQIHGSLSPPAFSNCGLPEGCALSCLGMMVIDIVFHEYMLHYFPLCQPLSYVDDWQVLVSDPCMLQPVYQCLEEFTLLLDLFLDSRKTHTWSVCAEGRSQMRSQGFGLVAFSKNLGAHVQYTRQHTNKVLMDRVQSTQSLWTKLRLSASPYPQKVRAIRSAAWPRCLHAVAATTVSKVTYAALRSGALRGLKLDAAGANPMVHLSLVEAPGTDPQFWSILQTLKLARECGSPHRIESVLAALVGGPDLLPSNSITHTLLARIQTLGWHVDRHGHITDMLGTFSIFKISATELQCRAEKQWLQVVASATSHRFCFKGLEFVDPADTRRWLGKLDASDQALFHKILNGTHFTQDGKHYCQESESDICPFCDCTDGRFHRFWICPQFEHHRQYVTPEVFQAVHCLPEALTCSGWSLAPSTQLNWDQYFVSLVHSPVPCWNFDGPLNVFTDGSCHGQHRAQTRFAGWAVVLAATEAVHDYTGSQVLDAGVLPGYLQSAVRAEIYAVLRALQITRQHVGKVMLWCDCAAVVKRLRRILAGHDVKKNCSHSDLWVQIRECLQERCGPVMITKVAAHQTENAAPDVFTEWCIRHNSLADKQAVRANLTRTRGFWYMFQQHIQALDNITAINRCVQQVQLASSQDVVRLGEPVKHDIAPIDLELPPPCRPWCPLPSLQIPDKAVRWYGDATVRRIVSWFWQTAFDSIVEPVWVSHYQLYVDYMCCTGHPGPVNINGWIDGERLSHLYLRGLAFRTRARWFAKVWREILRHQGIILETAFGRPCSQVILLHTGCVSLPWPRDRLENVDRWMFACSQTAFKRQSTAIDSLPFASIQPGFPPCFQTTAGA